MRLRIVISLIVLSVSLVTYAQQNSISKIWKSNEQIADRLFADQLYDAALSMYLEEALNQNIFNEDGSVTNPELSLKIADSYYKLRKLAKAAIYFQYVLEQQTDSVSDEHLLRYAESLLYSEKIPEAKKWFNAYYLQTDDPLGKERFRGTVIYDELMASIKPTTIKSNIFNNSSSFITPKVVEGQLYFSGPSTKNQLLDQRYLQGDMELYDLFVLDSVGVQEIKVGGGLFNVTNPVKLGDGLVLITANARKDSRLLLYEGQVKSPLKWGDFTQSSLNDSTGSIHSLSLTQSEDTLYFSSDRAGGFGHFDLYYSVRVEAIWSKPVNMGPYINSAANEIYPYTGFGHFCFSSDGHPGLGGYDLFEYEYGEVVNMASPLNTSKDDMGVIFTDAYHGYLFSNRSEGEGKDDIYEFTQTESPEVPFQLLLTRKVNDGIMSEATVTIQSLKGDHRLDLMTDEDGAVEVKLHTRTKYLLTIEKEGFIQMTDTVNVLIEALERSYTLDEMYSFQALVFSAENDAAIANPTVFIENITTQKRSELSGNATGFFEILEPSNQVISILITKEGFSFQSDTIIFDQRESTKTYSLRKVQLAGSLTLKDLLYELDQHKLQADYVPALDSIANSLNKFENLRIIVESHTDSRGDQSYNLQLSQLRAESVKEYLISKGIAPSRVGAVGKGEQVLLNGCKDGVKCSAQQHMVNRRTEIKLFRSQ
ncbi:MAG: outer membrane protein OmpA-like peptidoglycan-associated protein [Cyclobacteriaceae bacterium]|jgi:outer membrane protein OmpA-like peptidoglycan-associated protein